MNDRAPDKNGADGGAELYVLQAIADDLPTLAESVMPLIGVPERIDVAANDAVGPSYVRADGDLNWVLACLEDGTLGVAALRTPTNGIRLLLLTAPCVFGGELSQWVATLEFSAQGWRSVWNEATRHPRLRAATLTLDDSLDLRDEHLSVDTFPWEDSRIVIAGVRSSNGSWITRENANPSWGKAV
jgi:hypothetical protein